MKFERIRSLREDADKTQKELGEYLHISQRTYAHYENGTRNIPIEMLIRLAYYYNTSIDYLVGITDDPNKKKPNSKNRISPASHS
ncbi:MAG: helix-turn-helix domain-containing protein [Blautia sp.]